MRFFLFIILNAVLFLRPQDLIPGAQMLQFYEWTILACLLATFPAIVEQLSFTKLVERPVNVCVLGVFAAAIFSHVFGPSGAPFWYARDTFESFGKVILYFFLAVAVMDSRKKIEKAFTWLLMLIGLVAALSLGHFRGLIHLPALTALERRVVDEATGESSTIMQLRGTGIFNDPNDLAMILVVGAVFGWHVLSDKSRGLFRFWSLVPLGLCLYGTFLTMSRGGALALLAASTVLVHARWGWRAAILGAAAAAPISLVVFAARGDGAGMEEGTGQERVQLWMEGFQLLKQFPLTGVGYDMYAENVGKVAHNSFVHCYTELGLLGGTFFFGAFFSGVVGLYGLRRPACASNDSSLRRQIATPTALLCGAFASMLTLSRSYVNPTYLVLAIACSTIFVLGPELAPTTPSLVTSRLDARFASRLIGASAVFLTFTYMLAKVTVRWG